jgi:hypothetical protein
MNSSVNTKSASRRQDPLGRDTGLLQSEIPLLGVGREGALEDPNVLETRGDVPRPSVLWLSTTTTSSANDSFASVRAMLGASLNVRTSAVMWFMR